MHLQFNVCFASAFPGIASSPHVWSPSVPAKAASSTCNSDYLGDDTYYADDDDDDDHYSGDIGGGWAWGEDVKRKTSSILGEMPTMGGTCSNETKDPVYAYACDVISSLNENIDGTDFAAVAIASFRRSNWVDARRQLVIGGGGTFKYSDYSVEILSSQIEDCDHFVKNIEGRCVVTSEVAEGAVRKIVAAIISDRPGPFDDEDASIDIQHQYESGSGDDDASQGSGSNDSRFSIASSLGRRSRVDIQSFGSSPARIRRRSTSFGSTFDGSANDEVPRFIAIGTDSRAATTVLESDACDAGDVGEEDELVLDETEDGADTVDNHSAVNEVNSTSAEEESSISYFSTGQLTREDLVKFCEAIGVPVAEPKEANGNLEERMHVFSARFPLDGKPRLPGVAGRMALAGVEGASYPVYR